VQNKAWCGRASGSEVRGRLSHSYNSLLCYSHTSRFLCGKPLPLFRSFYPILPFFIVLSFPHTPSHLHDGTDIRVLYNTYFELKINCQLAIRHIFQSKQNVVKNTNMNRFKKFKLCCNKISLLKIQPHVFSKL